MKMVSIADLKAHASDYIRRVQAGEAITVTKRNRPVAVLTPLSGAEPGNAEQRPFGLCKGRLQVPDDFNAPLPEGLLAAFEGR